MCGRFTQRFSWQQVHDYMNLLGAPVELTPRYNVAPGQHVAAIRAFEDGRRLSMLREKTLVTDDQGVGIETGSMTGTAISSSCMSCRARTP